MGCIAHTCLPFGIKNSPAIFQNYLDKSLAGIEGCLSYQDDIIIFADDKNEHDKILEKVNNALNIAKLKVNENKCEYNKNKILYLGHMVSYNLIQPNPAKTSAINRIKIPVNVKELQQFLGMVNYYHKFIKNCSEILAPLTDALQMDKFIWNDHQQTAFDTVKSILSESPVLSSYNPNKELILTCDSSCHSIGATLEQNEHPVLYISKKLSETEKNYAQIDREALAII